MGRLPHRYTRLPGRCRFFRIVKDFAALNRIIGESAFTPTGKDVTALSVDLDRGEAERLVHSYSDLILRLSYTYLKSTDDAQDICQTVFLKLLQKPQHFASPEHEKAWMIRTAANLCKDHLKSRWRRTTVALEAAAAVPAPEEGEGSLLSAVNLLPPKYRAVIYLYYYEGYSAGEMPFFPHRERFRRHQSYYR